MTTPSHLQWQRKVGLIVLKGEKAIDLSDAHIKFRTVQQDAEAPNNCWIRVYNLSRTTYADIANEEFDRVILQAGYESSFGVIFDGTLKQRRNGREGMTDTYIDLLVADGDQAYNFSLINKTLAAGWNHEQVIREAVAAMATAGVTSGFIDSKGLLGGTVPNPRGKVMWGLPRALLRTSTASVGASWSIDNGKVNVVPYSGYKPGEVVSLNSLSGLIGRPEQTLDGVRGKCLLNPRIEPGQLVRIGQDFINRTLQQNPDAGPVAYNQWAGLQLLASIAEDGLYRTFVAEHVGDTRGQEWYTEFTCLAVNEDTSRVRRSGE